MTEVRRYGALARFLRHAAGRIGSVEHRLRELGFADDALVYELRILRRQATRWADRVDAPPAEPVPEDEITVPLGLPGPDPRREP